MDPVYGYEVYCTYNDIRSVVVKPLPSAPSVTAPSSDADGAFTVTVNPVAEANEYVLSVQTNGGSWQTVGTYGSAPSVSQSKGNGVYGYRAKACNPGGCSSESAVASVTVAITPGVPPSISVPAVNGGSYSVSWEASSGSVTSYDLDRRLGSGSWTNVYDGSGRSVSESVSAGSYTYRVRACRTTGSYTNCSGFRTSGSGVAQVPQSAPAITLSSTNTSGAYTVSWGGVSNSTTYLLQERQAGGSWSTAQNTSATSKAYSGKSSNTYEYRVQACNGLGCSSFSAVKAIDVAIAPSTPASITVPTTPTDGSYAVSWGSVSGTTRYDLERNLNSGSWANVQGNSATSKPESGLAIGSYTYRVRACRVVGAATACSGWRTSSSVSVAPPATAPSLTLAATSGTGSFTVSWTGVGNTSSYVLEENPDTGTWSAQTLSTLLALSKDYSGKGNGTYSYRVRACNAVGCSSNSSTRTVDVALKPGVPSSISVPEATANTFTISWGAGSGSVTTYKLERVVSGSGSQIYAQLSPRSVTESGLAAGTYSYRVRACRSTRSFENCSNWRSSGDVTVVRKPSMPLLGFTAVPGPTGGVALNWAAVANQIPEPINYFILEYQINGGEWVTPITYQGTGTSFLIPSIAEGQHQFSLRACIVVATSGQPFELCSDRNLEPPPVAKPSEAPSWTAGLPVTNTSGAFELSWSHVTDTSWYVLQERVGNGTWTTVGTPSSRTHQFSNKPSNRYRYRLQACNGFGCSDDISSEFVIDVARQPDVPLWVSEEPLSDGNHTVAWYDVFDDVTHYILQESRNNGTSWSQVLSGDVLTRAFTGLPEGIYQYRVAAFNTVGGANNNSAWSAPYTINVTSPEMPENVRSTDRVENNFTITWDAVPNTREYEVTETVGGTTTTWRTSSTSARLLDKAENTYNYRVRACNAIGCSDLSASVTVQIVITPGQPASLTATANSASRRTGLSWSVPTGSPGYYEVQQRLGSGSWSTATSFTGTSGNWPTAVTVAGTYQYRIRACRTMGSHTGCSQWRTSNTVTYAVPGVPTLTVPASSDGGNFSVSWTNSGYTESYRLDENGSVETLTGTSKTFGGSNAKAGGRYTYRVSACNALGCSEYSSSGTVTVRAANDGDAGGDNGGVPVGSTPPSEPANGQPVGTSNGQFRVNEAGAATYNIPLTLPQGTAGVTPQISFSYSSQGGNGLLGQGWTLGGISAITRCRQTLSQDGSAEPITWSDEDRFCLDGQRLLLDTGASYGAVGATYKTELDGFVTVTSHGGSAGNPSHFTLSAKDGSTTTYGQSASSRLMADSSALNWAVSRIQDSVGNRINFYYTGDAETGQRIDRIDYAYPAVASSSGPRARVEFFYEDRPDASSSYVADYEFWQTQRLNRVEIRNNGAGSLQEYRTYYLRYQTESDIPTDNISRLAGLEECVGSKCYEETVFTWPEIRALPSGGQQLFAGVNGGTRTLGDAPRILTYQQLDINGDGRLDLAWVEYRNNNLNAQYLGFALANPNASGSFLTQQTALNGTFNSNLANASGGVEIHVIDYNGDGRQDVVARQKDASSGAWKLFLSVANGTGWRLELQSNITLPFANAAYQFGDINGDGMADAYYVDTSGNLRVHYLTKQSTGVTSHNLHYRYGNSSFYMFRGLTTTQGNDYWQVHGLAPGGIGDFNGDGRQDLVAIAEYYTIEWHTNATEPGPVGHGRRRIAFTFGDNGLDYFDEVGAGEPPTMPVRTIDLNGDGLTDVVYKMSDGWRSALNTGEHFSAPVMLPGASGTLEDKHLFLADINRDGYPDMLRAQSGQGLLLHPWLPASNRFSGVSTLFSTGIYFGQDDHNIVLDLDGDGWNDVVRFRNDNSSWSVLLASQGGDLAPNFITKVRNGLGNEIDIKYQLLTHSDHYSRVDVGQVITHELDEVCTPDPRDPYGGSTVCYTPVKHTLNTTEFYRSLNDPFSTLPDGNDHLDEPGSPVLEIYAPMAVVTEVASSAPVAGDPDAMARVSYFYDQMKFQASGRGPLGFRKLSTVDHQTGTVTETTYRQDWPFVGSPLETVVRTASGNLLSRAINKWALDSIEAPDGTERHQTYVWESVEENYALVDNGGVQGQLLSTVTTTNLQDAYGNPENITIVTEGDGETLTKVVDNEYGDEWNRRFGRLTSTTVTTTRGAQTDVRRSEFTYFPSGARRGLLHTEVVEPGTSLEVTTTYSYDGFGNKTSALKQAADGTSRQSETTTYELGRYVDAITNALGQTTHEVVTRNRFGLPTLVRDIHNTETVISYDDMGAEYQRQDETGAWSWTGALGCGGGIVCPDGASYRIEQRVAGGGASYSYHDVLGRVIRKSVVSFNGTLSHTDTEYDNLGRAKRVSTPYFASSSPAGWTESRYDILGRVVEITLPDDTSGGTTEYQGYSTVITNALGHTKTETRDVAGNLVQVTDNLGGTVRYQYDLGGNLLSATTDAPDANPVTVRMCYDGLGRKIAMHDPDKGGFLGNAGATCQTVAQSNNLTGWWRYQYNGIGDLVAQTDTKRQGQTMTYDTLGRLLTRTDRRADGSVEGHTRWFYDGDGNPLPGDLGNLTYVVQSHNSINESCSGSNYCTAHVYDRFGRGTDTVVFHPNSDEGYMSGVRYDLIGRPYVNYDALQGLVTTDSGTRQHYNAYGYPSRITDLASGNLLYEINAMDARGQVLEEERGNGVVTEYEYDPHFGRLTRQSAGTASWLPVQDITYDWDEVGNLNWRHNQSVNQGNTSQKNLRESFCYDGLNRLVKSHLGTLGGSCSLSAASQDVEYNGLGNITRKAGVGSYIYGTNAGPHAVTRAGSINYTYDANGNMTGGDGRALTYSTYDQPVEISKGNHTTQFRYGPGRDRYLRVDINGGVATTTTYLGNVERIHTAGDDEITWRRTVAGAIYTVTTNLDYEVQGDTDKAFVYKDHLGSTDVITDAVGTVVESQSFDAWGQRRNSESWNALTSAQLLGFNSSRTERGYTGHEHMDEMGLIHMNGRIYDAKLGRFLQADPFIQAASDTQSYNRYSYLMNNPLNATDPSGFFLKKLWDKIRPFVGAIVGIVLAIYCGPCSASVWGAMGAGAAAGAAGAAANGGNILRGALTGALSGAVFFGIGAQFNGTAAEGGFAHILSHATAGGVLSVLQGGKFGHGFISAGLTKAANISRIMANDAGAFADSVRTVVAAIVGGTISEITGGKFANGAITAAMAQAFNGNAEIQRRVDVQKRFSFEVNNKGKAFPEKMKEKFLAVAAQIDGDMPWSTDETVKVFYNPGFELLESNNAHAVAYRNSSGGIEIVLGKMSASSGLFRSIVAEEIFHAADYTSGWLHKGMSQGSAWHGEVRAISYVLQNKSVIKFNTERMNQLKSNLANYKTCLGGGSTAICTN